MQLEESLQRAGDATYVEDGIVLDLPHTAGVLDGFSFYHPKDGPPLLDGLTQGQFAVKCAQDTFPTTGEESSENLVVKANGHIRAQLSRLGLTEEEPEHLPGASFCIVRDFGTQEDAVHILWTGDCGAVWENCDGNVGGTFNQARFYESVVTRVFASIKKGHKGDRNATWAAWLPIRARMIRRYQNKKRKGGWGALTGELAFERERLWEKMTLTRSEVSTLILFTDGCVAPEEELEDPVTLATRLIGLHKAGGLSAIYGDALRAYKAKSATLPTSRPEATALALSFSD